MSGVTALSSGLCAAVAVRDWGFPGRQAPQLGDTESGALEAGQAEKAKRS